MLWCTVGNSASDIISRHRCAARTAVAVLSTSYDASQQQRWSLQLHKAVDCFRLFQSTWLCCLSGTRWSGLIAELRATQTILLFYTDGLNGRRIAISELFFWPTYWYFCRALILRDVIVSYSNTSTRTIDLLHIGTVLSVHLVVWFCWQTFHVFVDAPCIFRAC